MTDSRTKADFAEQLRIMVDERYPDAELIVPAVDNLNTHGPQGAAWASEEQDRSCLRAAGHEFFQQARTSLRR